MSNYTQKELDQIWEKAEEVPGKNPNLYRKDELGNLIYKPSYGKHSEMGWEVDHKKPKAKGGTDNLRNLRPLGTEANRSKGDKYPYD